MEPCGSEGLMRAVVVALRFTSSLILRSLHSNDMLAVAVSGTHGRSKVKVEENRTADSLRL